MERKSGSKSRITTQNAARDDEFDAKHYRVRTEKRDSRVRNRDQGFRSAHQKAGGADRSPRSEIS